VRNNPLVAVEAQEIVGREEELGALVACLEQAQRRPRDIVLEGEAGIGKTTLWRHAVGKAQAYGYRVLSCTPGEAETHLAFSGLRDLLDAAYEDVAHALPPPQRRALDIALLRAEPGPQSPDQGAVAAAFLASLRLLAEDSPVLVAVDDVQWLDGSTAFLIGFIARRLQDERIALLVALRSSSRDVESPLGVREQLRITLSPLSIGALHRILRTQLGTAPSRPMLVRLHELAGGNPFYALEIARALQRREEVAPGDELPLPARLQDLVAERLVGLPERTVQALQVMAALSRPTVTLVTSALQDNAEPLEPALAAHVISTDGDRLVFTHPLFASGAYATVDPARRRDLHWRLAELVEETEERARHLALAALEPSAAVAGALEDAARRARARGAPSAAADLAEQAQRLTPPDAREDILRRTIEAASNSFEAGDAARARALFERAVSDAPTGHRRATALVRLARAHAFGANLRVAARVYRQAIADAEPESSTRAEAEEGLAVALMRMLEDLPTAAQHAAKAAELAMRLGDSHALAEFRASHALIVGLRGDPQALRLMQHVEGIEAFDAESDFGPSRFLRTLWGTGFMSSVLRVFADDLDEARAGLELARARAVEVGDEASLPLLLRYLSLVELLAGDWPCAERLAAEGYEASLQTGQPSQQAVLAASSALIGAHRGNVEVTRATADEALRLGEETGSGFAELLARSALGLLELSLANPDRAAEELEPLVDAIETAGVGEPGVARFVPDAIEARVAVGRLEDAGRLLASHEECARRLDRPSALAAAGRCRALLLAARTDFDGALASVGDALAQHARVAIPFERGRTLLVLGAVQRRAKRKRAAREALEEALAVFERLGAGLFAEQARLELGRIGGRGPATDQLTPTERRVAGLVAEGRSTKEVAASLFVSPKTVEGHLSRIYAKLGIHSRAALARELSASQ
jgi:DNA-binding CsgD family transcriptional regulator